MITNEEIKLEHSKVNPQGMPRPNPSWKILFEAYNERHEIKLHMGCMSCYAKVYFYFKKMLYQ